MQQQYSETPESLLPLPNITGTRIYGNFDGIDVSQGGALICGWAFDAANPDGIPEILVVGSAGIIGRGKAELARPDVRDAGVPRVQVGFRVRLKPKADERELVIVVISGEQKHVLQKVFLKESLPIPPLTREDVVSVFNLLFHRCPESEDAINHQLLVHKSKTSLLVALFSSPEFHEKNMDLISLINAGGVGG